MSRCVFWLTAEPKHIPRGQRVPYQKAYMSARLSHWTSKKSYSALVHIMMVDTPIARFWASAGQDTIEVID